MDEFDLKPVDRWKKYLKETPSRVRPEVIAGWTHGAYAILEYQGKYEEAEEYLDLREEIMERIERIE